MLFIITNNAIFPSIKDSVIHKLILTKLILIIYIKLNIKGAPLITHIKVVDESTVGMQTHVSIAARYLKDPLINQFKATIYQTFLAQIHIPLYL